MYKDWCNAVDDDIVITNKPSTTKEARDESKKSANTTQSNPQTSASTSQVI